jgi:protein-tyrosine phosphatase
MGNYFRSRYAEKLFNHLVALNELPGHADSCGVKVSDNNKGAISVYTELALADYGINLPDDERLPKNVEAEDIALAQIIVLTDTDQQSAHIRQYFPGAYETKEIVSWNVPDVTFNGNQLRAAQNDRLQLERYQAEALAVLQKIDCNVKELVAGLFESNVDI